MKILGKLLELKEMINQLPVYYIIHTLKKYKLNATILSKQ